MRGWHNPPPEPFLTSTTALMDVFEDDDEVRVRDGELGPER